MTTRLAGTATYFLPFNKGRDGGAGNPPDPAGRTYRTAYLWEEVLQRDSLLDLLARFLHLQIEEKRDDEGRKVKKETMIFPALSSTPSRTHVGGCRASVKVSVTTILSNIQRAAARAIPLAGWLIGWPHCTTQAIERVFDCVIVMTDRIVLDQQLQDTIYQFEHKRGVVQKIDESSRQLAEALENAVPIIITTLQKFPFVSKQLLKMAEKRGETSTGTLDNPSMCSDH